MKWLQSSLKKSKSIQLSKVDQKELDTISSRLTRDGVEASQPTSRNNTSTSATLSVKALKSRSDHGRSG